MADEKNIPLYADPSILARDLSNSLSVASRAATSPDDESQLRAASRRLGIPLETARTDPAATKHAVEQDSFDASDYAKRFPTAAAYLANPDNALVARDDVQPLSAVEQAIRGQIEQNMLGDLGADPARAATDRLLPGYAAERREREQVLRTEGFAAASALSRKQQQRRELLRATGTIGEIQQPEATPGNILSGLGTGASTGFKSAKLGMAQLVNDLLSEGTSEQSEQYNRERAQLDFEQQLSTPEFDTDVARWTYGGFASLAQTAPAMGLSIATGSPALGLGIMGLQTYGESYGRYRGRGATKGMAALGASGEASVEVLTELMPMKFAVDRLGKAGLTQFFAGFLGRDMAGEQIATLAQDAIDTAIANPTKTWNDYLAERPEAAIQTAFATLVQSGTLAAIGEGVGRLAGTLDSNQYAADTANQSALQLQELLAAASVSMTRQRDPQSFAQLVQGAAEDSGSSPTEIFIDARILAPLLEGAGMTPEQMGQLLPSVQEQLEEALATDGAVAIPIGEATAAFAGSGLEQELVRNARVSEDAWTAAEAEEGAQLLAQLEQDAQQVLEEQTERQEWEDSSNAVFDTMMSELGTAGRFTPDVNRAYATLVRNFYAVQAGKLGITPQEMYAQFPLTVTSRAPGQRAEMLDQITPEQARDLNTPLELPTSPEFAEAVQNTPGAEVTDEGLLIDLIRYQKPEQEGDESVRTGVFYLPKGAATAKHYKTGKTGYGGTEAFEGPTLLRRPLFVKGATGGKAPEVAYDQIKGKKAYEGMRNDVLRVALGYGKTRQQTVDGVAEVLEKYGANPDMAASIVHNSREGNQLPYAVQENIVAHAVRAAGYDAVVGYTKGKAGVSIGEVFDVRELTYPARGMDSEVAEEFLNQSPGHPFAGFTREQFLGNPTITKDSNASTLQPRVLTTVETAAAEPFAVGEGLTARYSPDGAAVFDGDKVIASYNFGDTLVVDKAQRRQGIAAELVYQWRMRNPNAKPARERTKKSQALQEKVWERIEREIGGVLNQASNARATFNPSTLNIALLEKADLSSFLHETGHFFFEMTATLAAQPNAPQQIVADMQALLDHVGYTGTAAEWLAQPLNARREAHETIAETFEQYLFEGRAPSAELQGVFRRFRSWLISVYRSLQQMLATNERASLNPEVAAVFDRMIATDEAIAAAQAVRQFEPMFRSAEDAGMEPEVWAEYQATLQEQQAEAIEELQARTLRDLKWLDNARGRKLKELQKSAQAQRKAVRDEVTAEVNAQPLYRAMEFLKYGRIEDGSDQIQIEVTKAAKLNITELERMYPQGELGTGAEWRKLGYGKYGMLSDAGLHPDTVAEMFGFRSGRQLVTELLNAEPKTSVIEGMTDQRMLERHGDISSPEAMAEAANEALANDARARLVATELKAVTKATGSPATLTRAARQAAEQIVAAKPVRNLRPDLAAASAARARKAAEKAMASGDTAAAAQAKRTEILQVQLERAQRRTQQEHDKALAGFKKIFKGTNEKLAKSRDVAMVNAARAVLARYGLAPNTSAANAQAYQQLLENYDGAMAADIKSILQGLPPSGDFRDLTVEQFRGMRDVVNGLYYLSRRTRQMEIDGEKVDIDAVADEIVAIVADRSGGTIPPLPGYTGTPTGLDKWKASLLSAKASLTRVELWADNWGPAFKRYIWQPVSEATTTMRDKRNALVAQYRDLLKNIEKGITYNKIDAPELGPVGFTFNAGKSELLHAILHSGNQSNLTKLLLGRGWGTLDANGQLDTSKWDQFVTRMINEGVLTKADFDFAQGVWDLLETVKKDAQAAHKEMYGYYFNEVTADPINTPFGTYRGGYVPALADSLSSPDMAQKREQEELLHAGNSFMFPTTGKGFTQSRVFYNKPLELDLRAIGQHLDKVSRFAYLEPAIKDVAQLMGNKRVARALNGASPGAISDMLTPWLQRTARQSAAMPGKNPKMNRFFNGLRSRTGLLFMFGNIVNTLQQITGFSLAALKVPAPKLLRATASYLAHPMKMRQQVGERSPWLAERMANQSYAMQDQIDQILTNPNPYAKFTDFVRRHAYFLQQAMQNVMDPIVWSAAYDHATAQGATEKEARRYADETVRTTQGSFAPEDLAGIEVQSPFVRLFTQFYGYFNMWGNLIGNEANKAVRDAGFVRASPRLMFIWFAGLAIPAFVAELISQGAPDDEDDEDGDGLLDEWLAMFFGSQAKSLATMVPIAGHGAVLVANQSDNRMWNDRLNVGPALSAAESAGKGLAAILTGEVFDEEFTKTEYRSLLTLLGLGTGLPVAPAARAGGFLMDVEAGRKDPQSAAEMGIGIATGR